MKLLVCKLCGGECEFVGGEHTIQKKVKCLQCGFNNLDESEKKGPEVVIIRKRPSSNDTNQ